MMTHHFYVLEDNWGRGGEKKKLNVSGKQAIKKAEFLAVGEARKAVFQAMKL